jgi:signal transduction histidine kinase/DNA-binding response OmpR family regulator
MPSREETPKPRLLIIDDEPAVAEVMVDFLCEQGYELRVEATAEDGLAALAQWGPDVILTDINLPGQSGLEVVRAAKARDAEACVIVMTGQATTKVAIDALRHGAYDFVTKPFDLIELHQTIARGAHTRRLARANRELLAELRTANLALQRHEQELQRKVQVATWQMTTLFDLSKNMARDLGLQFRLNFVCEKSAGLTGGAKSVLFLQPEGSDEFLARSAHGLESGQIAGLAFRAGEGLGGIAARDQTAVRRAGRPDLWAGAEGEDALRGLAAESVLVVPLVADKQVLGTLAVLDKPGGFTEADEHFLTLFAGSAAVALSNAILHERTLELDRLKSEFVAVVSHEIRTPLTVVRGVLELLADDRHWQLDEKQTQLIDMASANAERLLRLINDILDFSKLQSANLPMTFAAGHLPPVVRTAAANLAPLVAERGVELVLELSEDLPLVIMDEHRVGQVVTNLLSNAIKFSPPGAPVTVTANASEQEIVVAVRDQGEGIAAADMPKLFRKFSQLDSSSTRRVGGTGLGLVICKGIAESHGGRIWVESELGKGSVFCFALPLAGPRLGEPEAPPAADAAQSSAAARRGGAPAAPARGGPRRQVARGPSR